MKKSALIRKMSHLFLRLFARIISVLRLDHRNLTSLSSSEIEIFARFLANLIKTFRVEKGDFSYFDMFKYWEKNGFHIIPDHFYQPIPHLQDLSPKIWEKKSRLVSIDMNEKRQLHFLRKVFPLFKREYNQFPHQPTVNEYDFHFGNGAFDGIDALVLYCMIRYFKPKKIIEVGSGWSTRIAAKAALKNGNSKLTSIEPYPYDFLKKGFPGLTKQIPKQIQEVDLNFFKNLGENDILFIDSSHTVKIGGDVNYLFLEVLPRLKKEVIIHIHDIFLPYEYPKNWVTKEYRFWNEQYLLHAFLINNNHFEILFANNYMGDKYKKAMKQTFPNSPFHRGGSIWLKKI